MTIRRLAQILPDRSQWLILGIVVAIIIALMGFGNLAILKGAALSRRAAAEAKQQQLLAQHERLEDRLYQAQQRQNLERRGYDYYRRTRADVVVVVPEASGGAPASPLPRSSSPPFWLEWLRRLAPP